MPSSRGSPRQPAASTSSSTTPASASRPADRKTIDEFPVETWEEMLRIDLTGVFRVSRATVPHMKAQKVGPHHQHRLGARPRADAPAELLRRRQGRRREPHPLDGARTRAVRHPRQRRRAGLDGDRWLEALDRRRQERGTGPARAAHVAHPARASGDDARRSPAARSSWRRRQARTSPATSSRSTAAGPPASRGIFEHERSAAGRRTASEPSWQIASRCPTGSTRSQMVGLYRDMVLLRKFELAAQIACRKGETPGFLHLYIGQEATAAGVCAHLRPADWVTSTHRGHGHALAQGHGPARADGRALRQARRLLRRPRRHHAPLRSRHRPVRHERPRRRRHSLGGRRRDQREIPRHGRRRGRLLRRRRDEPRGLPRGSQFRRRPARAGRARLREQPLRHRDGAFLGDAQPGDRDPRRCLRHPGHRGRRQRRRRSVAGDADRGRSGRGAAKGRR